jgi:hypothetical protein
MAELYGLDRVGLRFRMHELFMTPRHKDAHAPLRDRIAARMPG